MALPISVDYEIYAGDTFTEVIQYNGTGDLVGATARCQLRANVTTATETLSVTPTIDDVAKTVTLTLTSAETQQLVATTTTKSSHVYDVEITFSDTTVETIQHGKMTTTLDVTR